MRPIRGVPPIIVDLISGEVPVAFQNIPDVLAPLTTGQVKALALTTKSRSTLLPDVPTLDQEGLKDFESHAWFALMAPKGTPATIVERLNKETVSPCGPRLAQADDRDRGGTEFDVASRIEDLNRGRGREVAQRSSRMPRCRRSTRLGVQSQS